MPEPVLSLPQIESFVDQGYCMLPGAFTAKQAAAASRCVWRRIEQKTSIRENDPATWPEAYDIEEHLAEPEVIACFSDRIAAAISQLVGPGRWRGERRWGFWPVNFSKGASRPWDYPNTSWHIDGNWFRHTIDSPRQGLLVISIFTDIQPHWGGTILALGSHKRTARVLARHPEGIAHRDLFREVLSEPLGNFHELNGSAGDAVLVHPFLFHTKGMKHGGPPRIISNTEAGLLAPLQLNRPNPEEYSILEYSIREALFEPPAPAPLDAKMCRF